MAKKNKKDKEAKKARAELKNQKNQKKQEKKFQKNKNKSLNGEEDDESDQDLDEILSSFSKKQIELEHVDITSVEKPSCRTHPLMFANPQHNKHELFIFGGEFTDPETKLTHFYNDLYSYSIKNNSWKKYVSQNAPLPRSSAAVAVHPSGIALLHGGEFSSPKQSKFYHYSDTWLFDCVERKFTKLEFGGRDSSPSARSGHRIIAWKNHFILFGGFRDLGNGQTSYLNDLWYFDISTYKWTKLETNSKPDARSGHCFIPTDNSAILMGGYCKIIAKNNKNLMKGKILNDAWKLNLTPDPKKWQWEKLKNFKNQPSPRVGYSFNLWKQNKSVAFGGVYDLQETEESLESLFYNDLYMFHLELNKWSKLRIKPQRQTNSKNSPATSKRKSNKDQEKELQDLLNSILAKSNLNDDDDDNDDNSTTGPNSIDDDEDNEDDSDLDNQEDITISNQLPHPRFNAATCVVGDSLFIYSGVWELGEKDYPINSFYSIDLNKLDGVKVYWEDLSAIEEAKRLGDRDSDEDEFEYEDDEEDEDDGEEEQDAGPLEGDEDEESESDDDKQAQMEIPDERSWLPHPKPFETLRAFYLREGANFLTWSISNNRNLKGKQLKTKSFELCEDRWWERRDQVTLEEERLEDTGGIIERDTTTKPSKRR